MRRHLETAVIGVDEQRCLVVLAPPGDREGEEGCEIENLGVVDEKGHHPRIAVQLLVVAERILAARAAALAHQEGLEVARRRQVIAQHVRIGLHAAPEEVGRAGPQHIEAAVVVQGIEVEMVPGEIEESGEVPGRAIVPPAQIDVAGGGAANLDLGMIAVDGVGHGVVEIGQQLPAVLVRVGVVHPLGTDIGFVLDLPPCGGPALEGLVDGDHVAGQLGGGSEEGHVGCPATVEDAGGRIADVHEAGPIVEAHGVLEIGREQIEEALPVRGISVGLDVLLNPSPVVPAGTLGVFPDGRLAPPAEGVQLHLLPTGVEVLAHDIGLGHGRVTRRARGR